MRLALRFILPLIVMFGLVGYGVLPMVDSLAFKWFTRDMDIRTKLIATAMHDSLAEVLERPARVQQLFNRAVQDERLSAIGFCDVNNTLIHRTGTFPEGIGCDVSPGRAESSNRIVEIPQGPYHLAFYSVNDGSRAIGQLVLVHDLSFVGRRSAYIKNYIVYFFLALLVMISLITVLIAQLSFRGWVKSMRAIIRNGEPENRRTVMSDDLTPIENDLKTLIRDLEADRRARDEGQVSWTSWTLKEILHHELKGDEVLTVSNREPYLHVRRGKDIDIQFPASGLVTALEPVMRACSGTWIAHGSSDADRDVVDENDHVKVPPEDPCYQIRRVWLTQEEEKGYYYGFSNEGIWPLCHIAHVRPIFRSQDWQQYVAVNEKFADAVVEEAKTDNPVVLVQDYHLALLPRMIKERLPKATIITFWHIPFPNPEVFGVCPWREEIIDGLLGSSILGFHTRFHCHNFLDAVKDFMEARINKETSSVSYRGSLTVVNSYPISIEFPVKWLKEQRSVGECHQHIRSLNGLPKDCLVGVGVDRLDYTKGILERFRAIERFLEIEPKWKGKFVFIQVAEISRAYIDQYQYFEKEVKELTEKINKRFGNGTYQPIRLLIGHHEPMQVYEYYRGANLCFVSSLHDGMNLVAKEFVAARTDEHGVLILSQFTGASRELHEALIVNPYNIDQCASALKVALEMPFNEQRNRMRSMRNYIQEFNVYRWAGRMLLDASKIRQRTRLLARQHYNQNPEPPELSL
tara:strand:+ start:12912 stop:15149 length:2238 start_codon:yes stop_codon:yes gene_type:complete